MQILSKYYIELSRYREATCFIREGLDLTQLHNCEYRIVQFLLNQINTDLIASNYDDASERLEVVESLLELELDEENEDVDKSVDLIAIRNFICMNLLKITKRTSPKYISNALTSSTMTPECLTGKLEGLNLNTDIESFFAKCFKIRKYLEKTNFSNVYTELFVEMYLNWSCFEAKQKSTSEALGHLKLDLMENAKRFCLVNEKWYLAHYYMLLYEQSDKRDRNYLRQAYEIIKLNPHPFIYRRLCIYLFHDEIQNKKLKATYLLETQSIALRHKSCSIQIKSKRKSQINLNLYENLNKFISFNADLNTFYDSTLNQNIPKDYTIIAFVLIDSHRNSSVSREITSASSMAVLSTPKTDSNLFKRMGMQRANKGIPDFSSTQVKSRNTRRKVTSTAKCHNDSDIIVLSDDDDEAAGILRRLKI
jgi:hypothetical protein